MTFSSQEAPHNSKGVFYRHKFDKHFLQKELFIWTNIFIIIKGRVGLYASYSLYK